MTDTTGKRPIWRKAVLWLVVLELAYLLVANLVLNSAYLSKKLNQRPERVQLSWDMAFSPAPALLYMRNLHIVVHSPRANSRIAVNQVLALVNIFKLPQRVLKSSWSKLYGIELALKPINPTAAVNPPLSTSTKLSAKRSVSKRIALNQAPTLQQRPAPKAPKDTVITPKSSVSTDHPNSAPRPSWLIVLNNVNAADINSVTIADYHLRTTGTAYGNLRLKTRHTLEVNAEHLDVLINNATLGEQQLLQSGWVRGSARLRPFVPGLAYGMQIVKFIDANLRVSGQLQSMAMLDFYFDRFAWLKLHGAGWFYGGVVLERGTLVEPTTVRLHTKDIGFKAGPFVVRGNGELVMKARYFGANATQDLVIKLDQVSVNDTNQKHSFKFSNLTMTVASRMNLAARRLDDAAVELMLPPNELPDMSVFNAYIPAQARARILPSTGTLSAHFKWLAGHMRGQLNIASKASVLQVRDHTLRAGLTAKIELQTAPKSAKIIIDGSLLKITNAQVQGVNYADQPPWHSTIYVDDAVVELHPRRTNATANADRLLKFGRSNINLHGAVSDVAFLNAIFAHNAKFSLSGGGKFNAKLRFNAAQIRAGSSIRFDVPRLSARFTDLTSSGKGHIQGTVHHRRGKMRLDLVSNFTKVTIKRRDFNAASIYAPAISITASNLPLKAGGLQDDTQISLNMPDATVPDIRVYNSYLPKGSTIKLQRGNGKLEAQLNLSQGSGYGWLRLTVKGLNAAVNGQDLIFDLQLQLRLRNGKLHARVFDITGSKLRLSNLTIKPKKKSYKDWFIATRFKSGTMRWSTPLRLNGVMQIEVQAARPLVELLLSAHNRAMPRLLTKILSKNQRTQGTVTIKLQRERLVLNNLNIISAKAELAAKLCLAKNKLQGSIYTKLGKLAIGVEVNGNDRDWDFIRPRRKYLAYPEF